MMTGMPTVNRDDFGNKHCLLKYSLTATPVKEVKAPRAADPCKRGHLKAKIEIDVYTVFADVCNLIHLRLRFPTFSPLKLILDRFALAQQNCIYYYNNIVKHFDYPNVNSTIYLAVFHLFCLIGAP